MIGRFVISKAGHDKGNIYVVVACEGDYVFLADGLLKKVGKPKRKNKKHIQLTNSSVEEDLMKALQNGVQNLDDRMKYAVKCYRALMNDADS